MLQSIITGVLLMYLYGQFSALQDGPGSTFARWLCVWSQSSVLRRSLSFLTQCYCCSERGLRIYIACSRVSQIAVITVPIQEHYRWLEGLLTGNNTHQAFCGCVWLCQKGRERTELAANRLWKCPQCRVQLLIVPFKSILLLPCYSFLLPTKRHIREKIFIF